MMHNYSENWRHLKSILAGNATRDPRAKSYSLTDHNHAKALSIFLANATLATPRMDRMTVESVLSGQQSWPNTLGTSQFVGAGLPLSVLEEYGLVAFYAGWCTVHCQTVRNLDNVDPSLIPLIQAVEHLKHILYGREGYVQPHYTCPADKLDGLLAEHFGGVSATELLPELVPEAGRSKLPPGNENFDALVSTYLWQKLRETLEPGEAFQFWILCLRVNCDWTMPVLVDYLEQQEIAEFNDQLLEYLGQDLALSLDMNSLHKQLLSEDRFASIVTPVQSQVSITIEADGSSSSKYKDSELEKPTLATLSSAYISSTINPSSDLQFVRQWERTRHWGEPTQFYTPLLASAIDASIRIDGQMLTSSGFGEAVLELSKSRPILKHLLFHLVAENGSANYLVWLLSQPATSAIALFYLTQRSFSSANSSEHKFTLQFDKAYQQVVCHEYLRTIEKETDCGGRLLDVTVLLGERCGLSANDFSKSFEYQFLLCLLDSLSHQRVIELGQAFVRHHAASEEKLGYQQPEHYWYLLGFWLIERLEHTGPDQSGRLSLSLKMAFLNYYKADFEASLRGSRRSLQPDIFFSALPWHKLIGDEGVGPIITMSNNCSEWKTKLSYQNENSYGAASAIRHYLQVLMCVGRSLGKAEDWTRMSSRIAEIVRSFGFGSREEAIPLFDGAFYADRYDLWTPFCSSVNLFSDSLYQDFLERCVPLIPLDQLFVLLERSTVIARTQKLHDAIANRQSSEVEDLGLSSLEQAFISASDAGLTDLATKLMASAKKILSQERFANAKHPHIIKVRNVWLSYEYKWQLMKLRESLQNNPEQFAEAANSLQPPHARDSNSLQENDRSHWVECDRFRRYIIAIACCDTDPEKSVRYLEALCGETSSGAYGFMLFKCRSTLFEKKQDVTGQRSALTQFLDSLSDTDPENMPTPWVESILNTYLLLKDVEGIDNFWMKLSSDQQSRLEILRPYCLALIARGDALIAQNIINRYHNLNLKTTEGLGLNELIDELMKALPSTLSTSQLVQIVNEDSQRTVLQLAKHYRQIVSREFEDYVAIVEPELQPHEFLKNAVVEVAQELLLRKTNLRLHTADAGGIPDARFTKEDLINDWFTSLFDKRMAESRIGFRDQKRGGQSESGKGPGEIDGYITDSKNRRIAIFEAFRLLSLSTTTISEHLNKIAGYDNESLSPVFIVAYCDVNGFSALVAGYTKFIVDQDYTGFTVDSDANRSIESLQNTDHLWLGIERRRRNHREIIFYHLLLNMCP